MSRFKQDAFQPLDEEENLLMASIDQDEWKPVANFMAEKATAIEAASNTIKHDQRIDLYLSAKDYRQIQIKALEEGVPYETLIASIIHKYLNGSLAPIGERQ